LDYPNSAETRVVGLVRRCDAALAGIRDREPLEKLPEVEREACRTLWDDVAALRKKVQGDK
jgi:hypothetical protein